MASRPQLTLPGLLALIAIALVLAYFERKGDEGGNRSGEAPPATTARNTSGGARNEANAAGAFDYYSLVLSWSPTHCDSPEGRMTIRNARAGTGGAMRSSCMGSGRSTSAGIPRTAPHG